MTRREYRTEHEGVHAAGQENGPGDRPEQTEEIGQAARAVLKLIITFILLAAPFWLDVILRTII